MDSRTRLVIGGATTVAASVAVVCAVAMTTSAALVDTAGAAVDAAPVVVPASSASPTPLPTPITVPSPPAVSAPVEPETVPAPQPEDVAAHSAGHVPAEEPSAQTEEQLAAAVAATGSWDAVYAWAAERGWSTAEVEAWIARLDARLAASRPTVDAGRSTNAGSDGGKRELNASIDRELNGNGNSELNGGTDRELNGNAERRLQSDTGRELHGVDSGELAAEGAVVPEIDVHVDRTDPPPPSEADTPSERDPSDPTFGSKREQSRVPPD